VLGLCSNNLFIGTRIDFFDIIKLAIVNNLFNLDNKVIGGKAYLRISTLFVYWFVSLHDIKNVFFFLTKLVTELEHF